MSVTRGGGIALMGGVVTIVATPAFLFALVAATRQRGEGVFAYLACAAGVLAIAGIAACRGSRLGAVVISGLTALFASGLIVLLLRTPALQPGVIAANVGIAVLLLVPSAITALDWRQRSRLSR